MFRMLTLCWAVLQVALSGGVAVLDGAEALRTGGGSVTHVEDASTRSCQPPHSAECSLCRYLSGFSANDARLDVVCWDDIRAARDQLSRDLAPSYGAAAPVRSRSPPLV